MCNEKCTVSGLLRILHATNLICKACIADHKTVRIILSNDALLGSHTEDKIYDTAGALEFGHDNDDLWN